MVKNSSGPKVKDTIKTPRKIKIIGTMHIKVLSSVAMNDLPKGTEGQIYKLDANYIYASFKAFSSKYDLDLKIKRTAWHNFID